MMHNPKSHHYQMRVQWTGNTGSGTDSYAAYLRDHMIGADNKPEIPGSSDPDFRGNASRYNPEELLVASLAACHMLSYLHVCANAGVVVTDYQDRAEGIMEERKDGGGCFQEVILRPAVTVAEENMIPTAEKLHQKAHELCFIASSVNFPVRHQPVIITSGSQA